MEFRSVYRGVEEAALLGSFERGDHYHSLLSRQLRYRYREEKDLRELDIARLIAVSSLYGNKRADLESGNKFVSDTLMDVRSHLSYLYSRTSKESDRDLAVAHYLRVMEEYNKIVDAESESNDNILKTEDGR